MIDKERIAQAKSHPIKEIAASLGVDVGKDNKAYCFGGHDSATKSLTLYPNTNSFHCFGCGKSGDTIGLVREVKQCSFKDALDHILGILPDQRPPVRIQAGQRAVNGIGEHYADIYEFFIQLLPHPDANHYLVANRRLSLRVLEENNIRSIDADKSWHYRDKLIAAFPEDRLVSSGLFVPNKKKPGNHLFFYQCCSVIPFYRDGRIIYLQGLMPDELRKQYGKTRNLPSIKPPAIYAPKISESGNVYLAEGIISALHFLTYNDNSIAILSASSVGDEVAQELLPYKSRHFVLAPDVDGAGKKACDRLLNLLFKHGFNYDPEILSAKQIGRELGAEEEDLKGVRDVNDLRDILKK